MISERLHISEGLKSKFSLGGGGCMPPDPRILEAPSFQNLRSATVQCTPTFCQSRESMATRDYPLTLIQNKMPASLHKTYTTVVVSLSITCLHNVKGLGSNCTNTPYRKAKEMLHSVIHATSCTVWNTSNCPGNPVANIVTKFVRARHFLLRLAAARLRRSDLRGVCYTAKYPRVCNGLWSCTKFAVYRAGGSWSRTKFPVPSRDVLLGPEARTAWERDTD